VSDADAPAQKQFFLRRSLCTFGQAGFAAFSISGPVGILGNAEVFGQEKHGTFADGWRGCGIITGARFWGLVEHAAGCAPSNPGSPGAGQKSYVW